MDQSPLVNELIENGSRFLKEFDRNYPVAVAFWLKGSDESRWHLHIASQKISDTERRAAYGDVLRIAKEMSDVSFDPFLVRLRTMDDRIVQFAIDFQRRHPGLANVVDVPSFHLVEVDGMYIYPPLKAVSA